MHRIFTNERVLKDCKIYSMLVDAAKKPHASFHMPGHKISEWDITELSYSDNLSAPSGCIQEAENDLAKILGAERSFLLTDGSTAGVLSMLYAAKRLGVKSLAVCRASHKSVFNGCALVGITPLVYPEKVVDGIPVGYTLAELSELYPSVLSADGLFLTSPNYYGKTADLAAARAFCDRENKLLLVDGAHGGHLHFDKDLHAGRFADFWVDGVHKSLPALTQGAVVSARTVKFSLALYEGVQIFRTTSPSYPIMASVEYAVKYPRNEKLEKAVRKYVKTQPRIKAFEDWTKLSVLFNQSAFTVQSALEKQGIYAEFCDGKYLQFYLSPVQTKEEFFALTKVLNVLLKEFPLEEENTSERVPAPVAFDENAEIIWVDMEEAVGKICAVDCGLFPPCTPLVARGERVEQDKIELMKKASNVFGIKDGKIAVLNEKKGE
ncbi:MAG: aminotransferase class I/II-fold pyridoxal phosphate-dependent enzyme [Clostridiales bacterium]|nr:aminotransferase class I/II-fold pyridoxal phosphate-dependent enzyme [Clostridiales bacterium]